MIVGEVSARLAKAEQDDFPSLPTLANLLAGNVWSMKPDQGRMLVRLQVIEGHSWMVWLGDDAGTDERGWWGVGAISAGQSPHDVFKVAHSLLCQAKLACLIGSVLGHDLEAMDHDGSLSVGFVDL